MKSILFVAALATALALPQAVAQRRGPQSNSASGANCTQSGPCQGNGPGQGTCTGQGQGQGTCTGQGPGQGNRNGQGGRRGRGGRHGGQSGACNAEFALDPEGTSLTLPVATLQRYTAALQATLEKELYARDYYTLAAQVLQGPPRFGKLALAEQKHADHVASMITYLGGTPVLAHNFPVVPPATVAEADATCEQIELLVIDVYARLIHACPDPVLLPILNSIQASNYAHLDAVDG